MAHLRLCKLVCGSTSASLITPDMSRPKLVRLLLSRLRGKCKRSAGPDVLAGHRGGNAAHMSSFSDPLPLMQLAMMMAEATFSPLSERSIFSVGLVPLSSSIGSGWPSTLRARHSRRVQRGLTCEESRVLQRT